jgi:SIR2-like domain
MTAYILGAGASAHTGYPLASRLLQALSDWLDSAGESEHWVGPCRNRILQVRETFGSLDDFGGILGKLEAYGYKRVRPTGPVTYRQDPKDIFHDRTERLRGAGDGAPDRPAEGFYPQYLRSDLIMALREFFYQAEQNRTDPTAYDSFAARKVDANSLLITLNYDVALERALAKAGKWDVGTGYDFNAFAGRDPSPTALYKLHGSVNWFQAPTQENPPPLMFSRDLKLLGYEDLSEPAR